MGQFENMKTESLWSREVEIPSRRPLEGDKETEIAGGQTKNTTAKITSQHGLIFSSLIKK